MARPRRQNARPRFDRVKRFVKGMNAVKRREEGLQNRMWAMRRWLAKTHPPLEEHETDMLLPDMHVSRRCTQEDEDQSSSNADDEEEPPRFELCSGFPLYGIPALVIQPVTGGSTSSAQALWHTLGRGRQAGQEPISGQKAEALPSSAKRLLAADSGAQEPSKRRRLEVEAKPRASGSIAELDRVRLEVRIPSWKPKP